MQLRLLVAGAVVFLALAPLARGAGGSGIRELRVDGLVGGIVADGSRVAVNVYTGTDCDHIAVWSPISGERLAVRSSGYCSEGGESDLGALAGTRVLWEDGIAGNLYTDYEDFTVDARTHLPPAGLYSYEYTHDDSTGEDYGPTAGPFAGHGSLLVFASDLEHISGPDTSMRLWRVDGRHRTLIRAGAGLDFQSLSVDRNRIAGFVAGGEVLLLSGEGHTIRSFVPPVRLSPTVVLQGDDLALEGRDTLYLYDTRTGRLKAQRVLPARSRFQDYSRGLVALIRGNAFQILRVSDGKVVTIARVYGPGLLGDYLQADLEPSGLFYTYSTQTDRAETGHVVFVPWKTLQRMVK